MPTFGNYFIDGTNFATATGVWTNDALTTCATQGWYSDGATVRYLDTSGGGCVLQAITPCPSCYTPCGTELNESCSSCRGRYDVAFGTGGDVGAMIVYFNAANLPDGFRVEFGVNVFNYGSSARYGKMDNYGGTASPGASEGLFVGSAIPTFCGGAGGCFTCVNNDPPDGGAFAGDSCAAPDCGGEYAAQTVYDYDGANFIDTGTTTSWFISATQSKFTPACPGYVAVVVPVLAPTGDNLGVRVYGCCDNTGWDIAVTCPTLLTPFGYTGYSAASSAAACADTATTGTLYNAPVGTWDTADCSAGGWIQGTYGLPGMNDFIYTGAQAMYGTGYAADGWYKYVDGVNKWIEVEDGIVVDGPTNC